MNYAPTGEGNYSAGLYFPGAGAGALLLRLLLACFPPDLAAASPLPFPGGGWVGLRGLLVPAALPVAVRAPDEPGILHRLTGVIWEHRANITYVDITERREGQTAIYFELEAVADRAALVGDLAVLPIVGEVEEAPSFRKIYGKRIIVIGG